LFDENKCKATDEIHQHKPVLLALQFKKHIFKGRGE